MLAPVSNWCTQASNQWRLALKELVKVLMIRGNFFLCAPFLSKNHADISTTPLQRIVINLTQESAIMAYEQVVLAPPALLGPERESILTPTLSNCATRVGQWEDVFKKA